MENVTKRFGKVVANNAINLELREGEILSLLGENGSGKTTLMNMLSGIYFPDEGQIYIHGKPVTIASPKDAFNYGIGMIHQHFKLVDEDNIAKEMTDSIEAGVWSGVEMELNGRSGNYLAAAVLGTALMGIAGEEAEKISRGPGSFQVNLLDEIYGLSDRQLLDLLKIEMY